MPHNQYMCTPLIRWLITASMYLSSGNGIFSPARKKARSCLWRAISETEANIMRFPGVPVFDTCLDLKGCVTRVLLF